MREFLRDNSTLLEMIPHGTPDQPIEEMHFTIGPDGDFTDYFLADLHWHPEIEIVYIEKGIYKGIVNLDETRLAPGDLMFVGSQDLHYLRSLLPVCSHRTLLFHPKALGFSYEDQLQREVLGPLISGEVTFAHFLRKDEPLYKELGPILIHILNTAREQPEDWYFACKLQLIQLLYRMQKLDFLIPAKALISRGEQVKIERFKEISAYIDTHLAEPISLDQLASLTATNSQYLCRFFKEVSGMSPIQFVLNRRIDHAASLLRTTDHSVLDISIDCGFENVSYFIRKFRQLKGKTPGAYRTEARRFGQARGDEFF